MSVIEWKEPPPRKVGRFDWSATVAACKARPGEWALIGRSVYASNAVTARAKGLEVRMASLVGQKGDLYVRWVDES